MQRLSEWSYNLYKQLRWEAILIITTTYIRLMNQWGYESLWVSISKTAICASVCVCVCDVSCGENIHYSHTPPPGWAVQFGVEHLSELWGVVSQERKTMVNGIGSGMMSRMEKWMNRLIEIRMCEVKCQLDYSHICHSGCFIKKTSPRFHGKVASEGEVPNGVTAANGKHQSHHVVFKACGSNTRI